MSRARLLLMACFGVFAIGAVASTVASAAWDVGGTLLVGSAALASPALVLSHGKLSVESAGTIDIECTSTELGLTEAVIVHPDELRMQSVTFKECGATAPCSIGNSKTISTLALHGLAELDGTLNTLIKLLSLPSKTFAVVKFEGESCALLGTQPVTETGANADILIDGGPDNGVSHLALAFSLTGLKVGSSRAVLEGLDFDLKLTSGKEWRFL